MTSERIDMACGCPPPHFMALRDPREFARAYVEDGVVTWPAPQNIEHVVLGDTRQVNLRAHFSEMSMSDDALRDELERLQRENEALKLLDMSDDIRAFIAANESRLKARD